MTFKEFNTRVAEIETALETNENGPLIVSIGRAKISICKSRKYPLPETLELYLQFIEPFLFEIPV